MSGRPDSREKTNRAYPVSWPPFEFCKVLETPAKTDDTRMGVAVQVGESWFEDRGEKGAKGESPSYLPMRVAPLKTNRAYIAGAYTAGAERTKQSSTQTASASHTCIVVDAERSSHQYTRRRHHVYMGAAQDPQYVANPPQLNCHDRNPSDAW